MDTFVSSYREVVGVATTRVDLRHELRELYTATGDPKLVEVPELAFLTVDGQGGPRSAGFSQAIEALFSVSYTLKFALPRTPGGFEYSVMPLEALWWGETGSVFEPASQPTWFWTAMILQPDQITDELLAEAVAQASAKKDLPAAGLLELERLREGAAAQMMHIGPYSDEGPTIQRLHEFIASSELRSRGSHHEIYVGDPRRSAPERLKTILRQPVEPAG